MYINICIHDNLRSGRSSRSEALSPYTCTYMYIHIYICIYTHIYIQYIKVYTHIYEYISVTTWGPDALQEVTHWSHTNPKQPPLLMCCCAESTDRATYDSEKKGGGGHSELCLLSSAAAHSQRTERSVTNSKGKRKMGERWCVPLLMCCCAEVNGKGDLWLRGEKVGNGQTVNNIDVLCAVNGQGGLWLRKKEKATGGGMSRAIVDLLLHIWCAVVHSQQIGRPVTRGKEMLKRWVVPLVICCCAESADWAIHDLQGKKKEKKRVAPLSMSYCADRATCEPTATSCNTLRHAATHLNTRYNKVQHTATHCITLQHTASHCNSLQHSATHWLLSKVYGRFWQQQIICLGFGVGGWEFKFQEVTHENM